MNDRRPFVFSFVLVFVFLIQAFVFSEDEEFINIIPKGTINATQAADETAAPAPVAQIEPQMPAAEAAQEAKDEQLVSLDYKDAELSSVLKALAYSYGLNLVALKDVKGKVNVSLKDVTIAEALEAILTMNGYTSVRKGNILYVSPGPSVDESGFSTIYQPLNYLDGADAEKLLRPTLSSKGEIKVNEINNSLIITDYPYNLERIRKLLSEVDVAQAQVLIEAKVVDMQSSDYKALGITLNPDFNPGRAVGSSGIKRANTTLTLAEPSTNLSGGQFTIGTVGTAGSGLLLRGWDITATIDALVQKQKAHLLASPSIATLSGKEARIIIGDRVGYKEQTQTTTGTTTAIKFVDIGTLLRVTPWVSPDGHITMQVHPEVSSLASGTSYGAEIPAFSTREADATIRVRDGETIVIGGLIKSQNDRTVGRVPVLGYIPIINWFFSKRSSDDIQRELAVFITPHIIRDGPKDQQLAKEVKSKDVYVDIKGIGERSFAAYLYTQALNLEEGAGAESQEKDEPTRKLAAAESYLRIVTAFPANDKADDCLYRAGNIIFSYFRDYPRAKNIFSELLQAYPESPYISSAKRFLRRIERAAAALERKKAK